MTATSSISTRTIPEIHTHIHALKAIAVFCAVVFGGSRCMATYGLDLSVGFF